MKRCALLLLVLAGTFPVLSGLSHGQKDPERRTVVVFPVEHARAEELAPLLSETFPMLKLQADPRTNSLVVRFAEDSAVPWEQFTAALKALDAPASRESSPDPQGGGGGFGRPDLSTAAAASLRELRQRYQHQEQLAAALARQIRGLGSAQKDRQRTAQLRGRLHEVVDAAFQIRQHLQRAELAAFSQRLQRVGRAIDARDKKQEAIVEHRLQELLDPSLPWDAAPLPLEGEKSASHQAAPSSGPGAPPAYPASPTAGRIPATASLAGRDTGAIPGNVVSKPPAVTVNPGEASISKAALGAYEARLQAAEERYAICEALHKQGAISQEAMLRAKSDVRVAEADLRSAKAAHETQAALLQLTVKEAELQLARAKSELARVERLESENVIPGKEVARLKAAVEQAEIELARAKLQLEHHLGNRLQQR